MVSTGGSRELDVLFDITDLLEFCERGESVSGVQRVVAEVTPLLLERVLGRCVFLDRNRGVFIPLTVDEQRTIIETGVRVGSQLTRDELSDAARKIIEQGRTADPVSIADNTILVFLGALWISDALMMAARSAQASGARVVSLLYDLTPVLEAGHTAAVNSLFERYLSLLLDCASRVPAISVSSRRDFENYAQERGRQAPEGKATGLPCGLGPTGNKSRDNPWPRPFALFVGTIESRKNHALALRAWKRLIELNGADKTPDLVCVGRLGWHASEFLREYVFSKGLNGKVSVLSSSLDDGELAAFYEHAEFTVYPSRYEGWGLPVSESLAFGKVPVVARTSSLPEAGLDLAVYFESDSIDSFVAAMQESVMNPDERRRLEQRIQQRSDTPISWRDIAEVIAEEIQVAERRDSVYADVEINREYVLAPQEAPPDEGYADQYLDYLTREGLTPMLRQPRGERDFDVVDSAVIGTLGSPQTWGYEIRPGRYAEFRLRRPTGGALVLLVATRSMPGRVSVQSTGPGGPVIEDVYLGQVLTLPIGDGLAGEPAQVRLTVTDAHDSVEGFMGIRSFVVLAENDWQARTAALESAAAALRQELDFLQGTRSWKVTAPLRKWKGRGA